MKYRDYTQKIRAFSRDSLLLACTEACWRINDHRQEENKVLIRTIAPRIFSIAFGIGNNYRNIVASSKDILMLSHQYQLIDESIKDNEFLKEETEKFKDALLGKEVKYLKDYNIPDELITFAMEALYFNRLEQYQWNTLLTDPVINLARGWALYKLLNEGCSKKNGGIVTETIKKFFQQEPIHAYRAIWAIFILACDNQKKYREGIFNIDRSVMDEQFKQDYGMDLETIRLVAIRMRREHRAYREWHEEVVQMPEYYRKYVPYPLYQWPLISAETLWRRDSREKADNLFLCPSPEVYLQSVIDLFFRELNHNNASFQNAGIDILSEQGNALEEYLNRILPELFPGATIIRINRSSSGKKADFVIKVGEVVFVIEVKNTIGGAEARTVSDPKDLVFMWDRLLKSYIQCSETIKSYDNLTNKIVIMIVILGKGHLFSIQSIFNYVAFHSGIFKKLNLQYLEVLTLESFEEIFWHIKPLIAAEAIVDRWKLIEKDPKFENFRGMPLYGEKTIKTEPWNGCLKEAYADLFPKLALKKFN